MKKIIIVNNNMRVGGVQKSLYNLLWSLEGQYEITLCLFRSVGAYVDQLPHWVKIVETDGLFRFLGVSQSECQGFDKIKRGILAAVCRGFGRPTVMRWILRSQKALDEQYDCAIAFLHNGNEKNFYGGVQEFVLHKVKANQKVAFLHCDFRNCGADMPANRQLLKQFDRIAACSDGCREAFCAAMPELADRCVTVRNFHRYEEIRQLSQENAVEYEENRVHILMVSRLAHEKGIDRAIEAVVNGAQKGHCVQLHIVGGGPWEEMLRRKVQELDAEDWVQFCGEQKNPYRYMVNADLFLMASYHEAAPMVIEEAECLGIPVLTTRTTSSRDMVEEANIGWVCDNDQQALNETLERILADQDLLREKKKMLQSRCVDNMAAEEQFVRLIEA